MADSLSGFNRQLRRAWLGVLFWLVIALLAYVVIIEHRNHALDFLPYALLLVCPLMHVFMHGRHGHLRPHQHEHRRGSDSTDKQQTSDSNR